MRNLNLSYNYLDFPKEEEEKIETPYDDEEEEIELEDSDQFMENLKDFLNYAIYINHVDFSHMNFT